MPYSTEIIGFAAIVVGVLLAILIYRLRDFGKTLEDQESKLEQWRQEIYSQVQAEVFKGKRANMESVLNFAASLSALGVLKKDLDDLDRTTPRAMIVDLGVIAFTIAASVYVAMQPAWDSNLGALLVLIGYAVFGDIFLFVIRIRELFKIKRHIKDKKVPPS